MRSIALGPRISQAARKIPEMPLYIVGLVPPAWLLWRGATGALGPDPVKVMEHTIGLWGLQLLLASLCVTPLLRFARINLIKFRRPLGLIGALYILLHFLVWLLLDLQLRWGQIIEDLSKRPYIIVGFVALLLLVPLAATSWKGAIRAMGPQAWGRLHKLSYLIVILGGVHFVMQEKVWEVESLAYLFAAILLVGSRILWLKRS